MREFWKTKKVDNKSGNSILKAFSDSGIDVRRIDVLGPIFDFSDIEKSEKSIKKTWQEFRDALSKGDFSFDDIASAKKNTFLKVYDDLFNKNAGIEYNTGIKNQKVATGNYNLKSIMQLVDFYEKNSARFEPVREKMEVEGMPYPQMKMIDMGFWQVGFDLDTNKGIKNAH